MKKGITLVALVITIIILLILMSVTVSMLVGNDGVVGKTREGQYKTEIHEIIDRLNGASSAIITDTYAGIFTEESNLVEVRNILTKYNAADKSIIEAPNAFTRKSPGENIYVFKYTPEGSSWILDYTLDLEKKKTSFDINRIP